MGITNCSLLLRRTPQVTHSRPSFSPARGVTRTLCTLVSLPREVTCGCSFENCNMLSRAGRGCFLVTDGPGCGRSWGVREEPDCWWGHQGSLCPGGSLELSVWKQQDLDVWRGRRGISGTRVTRVKAKGQSVSEQLLWPESPGVPWETGQGRGGTVPSRARSSGSLPENTGAIDGRHLSKGVTDGAVLPSLPL